MINENAPQVDACILTFSHQISGDFMPVNFNGCKSKSLEARQDNFICSAPRLEGKEVCCEPIPLQYM